MGKDTGHCIVCPAVFHCGFPIIVIIISISLRSSSIRGEKLHFLVSSVMFLESPQWMPLHREIFFALLHCLIWFSATVKVEEGSSIHFYLECIEWYNHVVQFKVWWSLWQTTNRKTRNAHWSTFSTLFKSSSFCGRKKGHWLPETDMVIGQLPTSKGSWSTFRGDLYIFNHDWVLSTL